MKDVHVLPIDDIHPHEQSRTCGCKPTVTKEGQGTVVTHNSYDGRELTEAEYDAAARSALSSLPAGIEIQPVRVTMKPRPLEAWCQLLNEEVSARGWSVATFAEKSQLQVSTCEELLKGHKTITPVVALCLETAFGADRHFWLNLATRGKE